MSQNKHQPSRVMRRALRLVGPGVKPMAADIAKANENTHTAEIVMSCCQRNAKNGKRPGSGSVLRNVIASIDSLKKCINKEVPLTPNQEWGPIDPDWTVGTLIVQTEIRRHS